MRPIVIALMLVLGGSALALATPVAEASRDICLTYWYCVIACNTPPDHYCKCRPECPPPPEPDW